MELYFKDLISKESSLDKLVDDLNLLVQGADDFAKTISPELSEETRAEISTRLSELQNRCRRLKEHAMTGARATDRFVRKHPYASLSVALSLGVLLGITLFRRSPGPASSEEPEART
jgi:ElaB/YqjD/DUF883 family membrane-anchored ribosome-binding protein